MTRSFGRSYLAGSVSALVLSAGVAMAADPQNEAAEAEAGQNPETLVEVGEPDTTAVGAEDVGTAVQALVGMEVGDIEGMDIVNSADETIGEVSTLAENESGAIFLMVEIDEDVGSALPAGEHAIPLTAFDFNAESEVLVLRDDAAASEAAYSVLESDALIEPFDVTAYGQPAEEQAAAAEPASTEDMAATTSEEPVPEEPSTGQDQAAMETDAETGVATGTEDAVTEAEPELPATDEGAMETGDAAPMTDDAMPADQAATDTEEAMPADETEQAATEAEEAMPADETEQAAAETGEPAEGEAEDFAMTESDEEAVVGVEPSAGTDPGAAGPDAAEATGTDEPVTEMEDTSPADDEIDQTEVVGNARQILEEQGVTDVEGLDILNAEQDDIGTVEYVAQDGEGNLFLIVSLDDGLLGIGDSERVVELGAFDYLPEEESFVLLEVSEEALEQMPEWDSDSPQYTVVETELDWAQFN